MIVMHNYWKGFYLVGGVGCLWSGYSSMAIQQLPIKDLDWAFIAFVFVSAFLTPIAAMAYGRYKKTQMLKRPSLRRHPLGWWYDTLQPIRITLVGAFLNLIGSLFAFWKLNSQDLTMVSFYVALTFGLFIGERMVYRIYKKWIV